MYTRTNRHEPHHTKRGSTHETHTHTIADKQNKPQQTGNTQQSRAQPTNKQPHGEPRRAQQNATPQTRHAGYASDTQREAAPVNEEQTRATTAPQATTRNHTRHQLKTATRNGHARKPRNRTQQARSRGVPSSPTPQHHHARKPHNPKRGIACSRPARSNTGSGQTVDKREIPEHPQRERPPTRRDNHANTVQTRKREKPTLTARQSKGGGSPNRQEYGPQRTAEDSNLTRTIRANRLAVGPYTSQDYCPKEGKQNSHRARAARNKNPRTSHQGETPTPHR